MLARLGYHWPTNTQLVVFFFLWNILARTKSTIQNTCIIYQNVYGGVNIFDKNNCIIEDFSENLFASGFVHRRHRQIQFKIGEWT